MGETDTKENVALSDDEQTFLDAPPLAEMLPLNVDKYLSDIEEFDLSEEQAQELLRTLYTIMARFVELGFDLDPIQQILSSIDEYSLSSPSDQIDSNQLTMRFNDGNCE